MSIIELTLEDLLAALQPTGLPDIVLYQYYKNLLNRKIIINEQIGDALMETAILPFIEMASQLRLLYQLWVVKYIADLI